jgi:hypothetical protein
VRNRCKTLSLPLGLLAAACAPTPTPAPVVVAPVPKTHTCDQTRKAAAEFRALPGDSALAVLVDDYRIERKLLRAVHGLAEPTPCPK